MDLHLIERARRPGDLLFFYCSNKQQTQMFARVHLRVLAWILLKHRDQMEVGLYVLHRQGPGSM